MISTLLLTAGLSCIFLDSVDDLLLDRLETYDVYYKIVQEVHLHSEKNSSGGSPPVIVRPLFPHERPFRKHFTFRCRRNAEAVRLDELVDDKPVKSNVFYLGNVRSHFIAGNTFSIVDRSGRYSQPHQAYDHFRYLLFGASTLADVVKLRRQAGSDVKLTGTHLFVGPGDDTSLELAPTAIQVDFAPEANLSPQRITISYPKELRPNIKREVSRFKEVGNSIFVPLAGRIDIYLLDPAFRDKPANSYLLEVDEGRSRWNIPIDTVDLLHQTLTAGTEVADIPNNRSFIVGETSVPKNLDKLAEQATEVLFGSIEPKPEPYNWVLLVGGAAVLLLLLILGFYLRRRGRYA